VPISKARPVARASQLETLVGHNEPKLVFKVSAGTYASGKKMHGMQDNTSSTVHKTLIMSCSNLLRPPPPCFRDQGTQMAS